MRSTHRRSGFTLYQLLVVIALLAIVAGFLAPAIARVREAARRSQSQNNLKQITISMHGYASTMQNMLPPGNDANNFSGLAHLLPYLEQNNLWRRIDFKKASDAKANAEMRALMIRTYISPLDPVARVNQTEGPTNYFLNAGTKASLDNNDGVFYHNSKISIVQISAADGTSNTVGVVECLKGSGKKDKPTVAQNHIALPAKALQGLKPDAGVADFKQGKNIATNRGSSWMDGRFLMSTINAGRKLNDKRPDVTCEGKGGWGGPRSFSSTVNVGIMDGSVRSVHSEMSFKTWQNAMSWKDGNVLGSDW